MADSLVSEVSALLGSRLALRAGEEAYFGGKQVYTSVAPSSSSGAGCSGSSNPVLSAIESARRIAEGALGGATVENPKVLAEVSALRSDVAGLKKDLAALTDLVKKLTTGGAAPSPVCSKPAPAAAAPKKEASPAAGGDDDFDLFGSDDEEEDEEKKKIVEERLKAYAEKKSKKPGPIAKSSVILHVKPWDDETDMKEMEKLVREIELDGLVWGGSKLVPIGYGISKLEIICVIEDDKVSVDDLIEKIEGNGDHVQSVDIAAFNKI